MKMSLGSRAPLPNWRLCPVAGWMADSSQVTVVEWSLPQYPSWHKQPECFCLVHADSKHCPSVLPQPFHVSPLHIACFQIQQPLSGTSPFPLTTCLARKKWVKMKLHDNYSSILYSFFSSVFPQCQTRLNEGCQVSQTFLRICPAGACKGKWHGDLWRKTWSQQSNPNHNWYLNICVFIYQLGNCRSIL